MKAKAGDWLVIKGTHVDQADQRGVIIEVHGADGAPPYVVRWLSSGNVATVIPGPDAVVVNTDKASQMSHEQSTGRIASTEFWLPREVRESHPELQQSLQQALAKAKDARTQSTGRSARTAAKRRDYLERVLDYLQTVDWEQELEKTVDFLDQLARAYERGQRSYRVGRSLSTYIAARRGRR